LPLIDDDEIKLPPWFKWRGDCCTEARIVDENGYTLSYIELPEPMYLYDHFQKLEEEKRKNKLLKRLLHKIFSLST
jgi:hypothetical protein